MFSNIQVSIKRNYFSFLYSIVINVPNVLFFLESKQEKNAENPQTSNKLYKIKKPWNDCLAINKMKWKVQAARGNLLFNVYI